MTAPELLAQVEARGGSVAVARDATGAAMLKITPRGLVPDLLPELAKFKPALLELLGADTQTFVHHWKAATVPNAEIVEYVRAKSAAYWSRQRIQSEVARWMNDADRAEVAQLVRALDNGEEIE